MWYVVPMKTTMKTTTRPLGRTGANKFEAKRKPRSLPHLLNLFLLCSVSAPIAIALDRWIVWIVGSPQMPITRLGLVFSSQLCFASPSVEFTHSQKLLTHSSQPDKKLTAIVHARNQINKYKTHFFFCRYQIFFVCAFFRARERERREERTEQPESRTIQV